MMHRDNTDPQMIGTGIYEYMRVAGVGVLAAADLVMADLARGSERASAGLGDLGPTDPSTPSVPSENGSGS